MVALNLKELKVKELYKQEVEGLNETYNIVVYRSAMGKIKELYSKVNNKSTLTDDEFAKELCEAISDNGKELYSDMVAMEDGFFTLLEVFIDVCKALNTEMEKSFDGAFSNPAIQQVKR